MSLDVAKTILAQLGGNRFVAMTGAKLSGDKNSLTCRINSVNADGQRVKAVTVRLDASDTYTMTAYSQGRSPSFTVKIASTVSGLYCDQLPGAFERATGLYVRL